MLSVRLRSDGLLETSRDDGWTVFDPGGVLVHSCPLPVPRACSRKASSSLGGERPRRSGHTTRNGRRSGNPQRSHGHATSSPPHQRPDPHDSTACPDLAERPPNDQPRYPPGASFGSRDEPDSLGESSTEACVDPVGVGALLPDDGESSFRAGGGSNDTAIGGKPDPGPEHAGSRDLAREHLGRVVGRTG